MLETFLASKGITTLRSLPWGLIAGATALLLAVVAILWLRHENHALTVQNSALTLQLDAEQQSHKRDVAALTQLQDSLAQAEQFAKDDAATVKGKTDASKPQTMPSGFADALRLLHAKDCAANARASGCSGSATAR